MNNSEIRFFTEDLNFHLNNDVSIIEWLKKIANKEGVSIGFINYIFCSDDHLLHINRDYLNHDFYTDIITFHYHEGSQDIESDIYISIDRVKENAKKSEKDFEEELMRVIVHGLLHLVGYDDTTPDLKKEMRKKEDWCLSLRDF